MTWRSVCVLSLFSFFSTPMPNLHIHDNAMLPFHEKKCQVKNAKNQKGLSVHIVISSQRRQVSAPTLDAIFEPKEHALIVKTW